MLANNRLEHKAFPSPREDYGGSNQRILRVSVSVKFSEFPSPRED